MVIYIGNATCSESKFTNGELHADVAARCLLKPVTHGGCQYTEGSDSLIHGSSE
jgi:hypothetical protein